MSAQQDDVNAADTLILVDSDDNETGFMPKVACHLGNGILHRAFSVFLFDPQGRVLLQQRSNAKMLWGGYWANSCCSHPRMGETTPDAANRRTQEELGVRAELTYLYKFEYHAQYGDVGAEHELCYVYAGHFDGTVDPNPDEVAAIRFLTPDDLSADIAANAGDYTPWIKLEWARIRQDYLQDILAD